MGRYDKHSGRVGRAQGANVLFVGDDGYFDIGDVKGGANGARHTGRSLQLILSGVPGADRAVYTVSPSIVNDMGLSAAANGLIAIAKTSTGTASVVLPAASAGAYLIINLVKALSAVTFKASGASIVGVAGSDLSSIATSNGTVNNVQFALHAPSDGVWNVVWTSGLVAAIAEQASA